MPFMQIFTLGIAKFLLKHFHQDRRFQADVKLKSSYVYRVKGSDVDMAALAFLISPDPPAPPVRVSGDKTIQTNPEPARACAIVKRISRVWNIDEAIQGNATLQAKAVSGTEALLRTANGRVPPGGVRVVDKWLAVATVQSLAEAGHLSTAAVIADHR
jgi:hypothetical protein